MDASNDKRRKIYRTLLLKVISINLAGWFFFSVLIDVDTKVGTTVVSFLMPAAHASEMDDRGRIENRIPATAKKRDLALINKFLKAVTQGKQIVARDLLNPHYSGAAGDENERHISYASEKLPRLKIFGNKDAVIERVYYFQDVHKRRKHLRYYFVIYKPGMNQLHEVMKIELINYDNIYYLQNVWAPKKGSLSYMQNR